MAGGGGRRDIDRHDVEQEMLGKSPSVTRARRRWRSSLLSPLREEKMTGRTDDLTLDDSRQTASDTCPLPDCELDPTIHICTGIWMGRTIIDRRCLRLE